MCWPAWPRRLLAGRAGSGARRWAFWICAASPLLVHGWIVWAHSLLAGGYRRASGSSRWSPGTTWRGGAAVAEVAAHWQGLPPQRVSSPRCCASDGALVCLGLATVAGLTLVASGSMAGDRGGTRSVPLPSAGCPGPPASVDHDAIVGGERQDRCVSGQDRPGPPWVGGRFAGVWYSLLERGRAAGQKRRGAYSPWVSGRSALAGWAGWRLQRRSMQPGNWYGRRMALVGRGAADDRSGLFSTVRSLITGLFPAWPASAFIVGAAGPSSPADPVLGCWWCTRACWPAE